MEEKPLNLGCCREKDEKRQPYYHRDIKRKLSLTKKKIDDLQQQRKMTYKNSSKAKRIVHNQVNQIVKCLRSRERCLWSQIDDAYLSQDERLSEELLRLQTIYSNCQTLFDHLEDNPQNVLSKIYSTLAQVNFNEKLNSKAFEFTSELGTLKTMAADFGKLIDFSNNDEFLFIDKDSSSNATSEKIHDKREYFKKTVSEEEIRKEDLSNEYLKEKTDLEDLFEVVSFNDNESFEESENDFLMVDEDNFENNCQQIENLSLSNKNEKNLKDSCKFENSQNTSKDKDLNLEEEWKQLKNKVSSVCGLPNFENESLNSTNQNATSNTLNAVKSNREFIHLSPNELNDWLPKKRARKDKVLNKCTFQSKYLLENKAEHLKLNSELERNKMAKSYDQSQIYLKSEYSPAEIVRREFSKYCCKDGIENWLLH